MQDSLFNCGKGYLHENKICAVGVTLFLNTEHCSLEVWTFPVKKHYTKNIRKEGGATKIALQNYSNNKRKQQRKTRSPAFGMSVCC